MCSYFGFYAIAACTPSLRPAPLLAAMLVTVQTHLLELLAFVRTVIYFILYHLYFTCSLHIVVVREHSRHMGDWIQQHLSVSVIEYSVRSTMKDENQSLKNMQPQ